MAPTRASSYLSRHSEPTDVAPLEPRWLTIQGAVESDAGRSEHRVQAAAQGIGRRTHRPEFEAPVQPPVRAENAA